MRKTITSIVIASILTTSLGTSITPAYADDRGPAASQRVGNPDRHDRDRRHDRRDDRREDIRQDIRQEIRQDARQDRRQTRRVVRRTFRRAHALHGHYYPGYGFHYHDNDAWQWIAFAAITFKILDMISEEAQRKHEAAQIAATTAVLNKAVRWQNANAHGHVTATREFYNEFGQKCRDFSQTIYVGSDHETIVATGCLQADGSWKLF